MKRYRLLPLGLLLALAGCADVIPFAGGKLEGKVMQAPADWTEVAAAEVIQLETRPTDPYSVKLWIIGAGPLLYVHAGANRATWVEHIEVNADVRLLVDGNLYELRASRVLAASEFDSFADLYEDKYGRRPRNENVNEAYLFRLEPRG